MLKTVGWMLAALTLAPASFADQVESFVSPKDGYQVVTISCGSFDRRYTECGVTSTPYGRVMRATVVAQLSNAPCIANSTFGLTTRGVWVNNGCRAQFSVEFDDGVMPPPPPPVGDCTIQSLQDPSGRAVYIVYTRYGREYARSFSYPEALRYLDQARSQGYCLSGPVPPPPPAHGLCELEGVGTWNGMNYPFTVRVNGQILAGAYSYDSIMNKIREFEQNRVCAQRAYGTCALEDVGSWNGMNYPYRVGLNGRSFFGGYSIETVLTQLQKMSAADRVCRLQAQGACQLLGQGVWNGMNYPYTVAVGNSIMFGGYSTQSAYDFMGKVRAAGACY